MKKPSKVISRQAEHHALSLVIPLSVLSFTLCFQITKAYRDGYIWQPDSVRWLRVLEKQHFR